VLRSAAFPDAAAASKSALGRRICACMKACVLVDMGSNARLGPGASIRHMQQGQHEQQLGNAADRGLVLAP
jgi:hypothetical protein